MEVFHKFVFFSHKTRLSPFEMPELDNFVKAREIINKYGQCKTEQFYSFRFRASNRHKQINLDGFLAIVSLTIFFSFVISGTAQR